jgi:hypothetical protein
MHLGRNILIGAAIMFCVNLLLKATGWDSWEKFSRQADHFAEDLMTGASRLSPMSLWRSLTSEEHTYETEFGRYITTYRETGTLSFWDKIRNWFGSYWYTESHKAFWIGRILLILAILGGISMAQEDYERASDKSKAAVIFPFNLLLKFFLFLMAVGLVCLLLFFVIKFFLAIGAGIVFIVSGIHASGGFIKYVYDEASEEVTSHSKKTIAAYIVPFLFRRKK